VHAALDDYMIITFYQGSTKNTTRVCNYSTYCLCCSIFICYI